MAHRLGASAALETVSAQPSRPVGLSALAGPSLEALEKLPQLRDLSLQRCRIDDSAVPTLNGLKALKTLDLRGTRLTDEGLKQIRSALSGCRVEGGSLKGFEPTQQPASTGDSTFRGRSGRRRGVGAE